MVAIAVNKFDGMLPRYGDQVIPNSAASLARNCLLLSGELRPLRGRQVAKDFRTEVPDGFTVRRAYRLPDGDGGYEWWPSDDASLDLLKGPLVSDMYDRYYMTSDADAPRMNTRSRMVDGDPAFLLGVPAPAGALVISPTGGTGPVVVRAYTYTFVTAYGEEGQPVDATIATGNDDGTWNLSGIDELTDIPDYDERNITTVRIYRTVLGANGVAEYHFVTDLAIGTTTFADNIPSTTVALNSTLESIDWAPPPSSLVGLTAHPSGFFVGFSGRDIYFSMPYRPHAWPVGFVLSTKDPIVGLGVFGTTIVVATTGYPYTLTGIRPESMTFIQADTAEACMSTRRSIVSMPFGVLYPTDNGLLMVNQNGFSNITKSLVTRDEWRRDYKFNTVRAVRWQSQYVAFYNTADGFMLAPDEPSAAFVELGNGAWAHEGIQNDAHSGEVFLIRNNVVYYWNPVYGYPQNYTWVSKEIVTPKPINLGALKLEFDAGDAVTPEQIEDARAENAIRFAYPLNPLNFGPLNGVRKISTLPDFSAPDLVTENSQPTHKSPLQSINALEVGPTTAVRFRLYAEGDLVFDHVIEDEEVYRLPDGFKAKRFKFELYGNAVVRSVKMAETSKELGTI